MLSRVILVIKIVFIRKYIIEKMKKKIRLTESDLHRIVKESVKRVLKENSDFVTEDEISFVDKDIFGDENEHWYDCTCYDGHATGQLSDDDDITAPQVIQIKYPTMEEVMTDDSMAQEALEYRGLYDQDVENLTYGDIMMAFGEIVDAVDAGNQMSGLQGGFEKNRQRGRGESKWR